MATSYTFMKHRDAEYEWIIKDFSKYFNFTSSSRSHVVKSSTFDIPKHKDCRFYLEMTFLTNNMACSFNLVPCPADLIMSIELRILTKDTYKNMSQRGKIFWENGRYRVKESPILHCSNDHRSGYLNSLPKDLKILCQLSFYVGDTSIRQIPIPKHQSLKNHIKEILNNKSMSDVVFEVGDQEFDTHKTILMARSPVFLAMFDNDMIEKNSNRVKIEDITSSVFEQMIYFIYTDEIKGEVDLETGIDLLRAASKYQLEGLEALCITKLYNLLTTSNAMDLLIAAELYHLPNFIENIKNFIKVYQKEIQSGIKLEHFSKHPHHLSLFFTNEDK